MALTDNRPVRRILPNPPLDWQRKSWPNNIPAIQQLMEQGLDLSAGVTFLIGENGSGKSTIVEGLAMAYGFPGEGGTNQFQHSTRPTESPLHTWIDLERSPGKRSGFFLRAETMHGYYTQLEGVGRGGLHHMSHGESFLELLNTRCRWPGFYLLDESEAALSYSGQLALIRILKDLADSGAQVICATHSPLLAALPDATVWELGEWGIRTSAWEDLALVQLWRMFLLDPHRQLRHLF